jgi:hypothetical protein
MRRPVSGLSRSRERGAIAVVVAIVIFVLLAFLVLVMNVGHGYSVRAELQNAGDSAALAGVRDIGRPDAVPLSIDWTAVDQTASLTMAGTTASTYAGYHATDGTVSVSNPDIHLGIWHPAGPTNPTPWFQYVPAPSGNMLFQINAVQVSAARNAGQTGGPLTVFGSGLLGSSTMNVVTSATAVRFAPCSVGCAAPMVFAQGQINQTLPCETQTTLTMSQIGVTGFGNMLATAPWIRGLLMQWGGGGWYCKPVSTYWCSGPPGPSSVGPAGPLGPLPTAPAGVNVRNGGAFMGSGPGSATWWVLRSLACLGPPTRQGPVDVGIVGGSAPTSGPHSVATWARITVVGVSLTAQTITLRRDCGESERDATPGVAGRCRAVGLLSTRPVLMQ